MKISKQLTDLIPVGHQAIVTWKEKDLPYCATLWHAGEVSWMCYNLPDDCMEECDIKQFDALDISEIQIIHLKQLGAPRQ